MRTENRKRGSVASIGTVEYVGGISSPESELTAVYVISNCCQTIADMALASLSSHVDRLRLISGQRSAVRAEMENHERILNHVNIFPILWETTEIRDLPTFATSHRSASQKRVNK